MCHAQFHVLSSLRPGSYKSISPLLSFGFVVLGAFLLIIQSYSGSGGSISDEETSSKVEGDVSCKLKARNRIDQIIFKLSGKGTVHLDRKT